MYKYFEEINLNPDQKNAVDKLKSFLEGDQSVFLLHGYAGTGKTTLIKGLVSHLKANKKSFEIMAPTGRAAKILREKTGYGKTIHSSIYKLDDLETINSDSIDASKQSVRYHFPINKDCYDERIIIVDEASMISSRESRNELFEFGTNILLNDLLTYVFSTNKKNKIIFVGDPAQLPPVGDNQSRALDLNFFSELSKSADKVELTQVMRQEDNCILKNATSLRKLLNKSVRSTIEFDFDEVSFKKIQPIDVVDCYLNEFSNPDIGDGVVITYSNAESYHYNQAIRKQLFPNVKDLTEGDIILINNNNYRSYKTEVFNGDLGKVVYVSSNTIEQSAPVFVERNGKSENVRLTLKFRKIAFRLPHFDDDVECYIIDDLLHSIDRDLSVDYMKMLYVNFVIRFNEEQKSREKKGLPKYKVGSRQFKDQLVLDPFYNALRVKFGYAITCHKSQGGEWDKVFVDYSGRTGLYDEALRWSYTATTRGKKMVYAINPPYLTNFSKLRFSQIGSYGQIPKNSLDLTSVVVSPFHEESDNKAKSLKYWNVQEVLEELPYKITNIESHSYLERYTIISDSNEIFVLEASHKESGHFINQFKVVNKPESNESKLLESVFNRNYKYDFSLQYSPGSAALESLYFAIREACQELKITITNIDEKIDKYFVIYYLQTDSVCSYIQFYFKKNGNFSTAIPKSYHTQDDKKLQLLIQKLEDYAS